MNSSTDVEFQLYSYANRNKAVKTSKGVIEFDAKGFASIVGVEEDRARYIAFQWLLSPELAAKVNGSTVVPTPQGGAGEDDPEVALAGVDSRRTPMGEPADVVPKPSKKAHQQRGKA
jgi:hypothetical protein